MLSEPHSDIDANERVLIAGENGEEKALLFRAIGGLVAVGERPDHPPGAQHDHVHAGASVYPARLPSRDRRLSAPDRCL